MAARAGRLDLGIVGLSLLSGLVFSISFIEILAGPLEQLTSLNVQVLAVQTTTVSAPLVINLLLLLREGPLLVSLGSRLARRPHTWLLRLWLQQAPGVIITAVGLVPYLLAAALVAATFTQPELESLAELRSLTGQLNPLLLGFTLVKTGLFAAVILWINLDQGARSRRRRLSNTAALSRAISVSIAVVLALELVLMLIRDPSLIVGSP
jgi:hypothetical protein